METSITIIKYSWWSWPFAFVAMVLHHIPLRLDKNISFYKLLGSGKGGSFSSVPSIRQWAVLIVTKENKSRPAYSSLVNWYRLFNCELFTIVMSTISAHGKWDGKEPFIPEENNIHQGPVAIITRASIRFSRLRYFWNHVAPVANTIMHSPGILFSRGLGELPWIRQATFSIWDNLDPMKKFAYGQQEHIKVIKMTRSEEWYSEDLYARFRIVSFSGTIDGKVPLQGKL